MRFIVTLLMMFVLINPALARQANNNSTCSDMYRTYMNEYDAGRSISNEQMLNFHNTCVSSNAVNNDEPLHRKLLLRVDNVKRFIIVKA
jgi:hypothetical protein